MIRTNLSCSLRGTEELFGLPGAATIINSTMGKALGGACGGYTAGPKELTDILRQRSRPYLFSNSLPPPVVASASKVGVGVSVALMRKPLQSGARKLTQWL